ncbi:MAG: single-stranded DNA-binding protein [Steroidobacteraceae bacterium]
MLNKVQIIGRLGQEPEAVSEGVVRLNVATTETWKDRESGERREKTEWHQVTLFGKLGDIATNYLHKGSLVYIEGSLEHRKYEKDGATRYATSIKGRELRMLDRRPEGEGVEEGSHSGNHESTRSSVRNGGARSEPARNDVSRGGAQRSGGQTSATRPSTQAKREVSEDEDFDLGSVPF